MVLVCSFIRRICVSLSVVWCAKAATDLWLCRTPGASPTTGSYCSMMHWCTPRYKHTHANTENLCTIVLLFVGSINLWWNHKPQLFKHQRTSTSLSVKFRTHGASTESVCAYLSSWCFYHVLQIKIVFVHYIFQSLRVPFPLRAS